MSQETGWDVALRFYNLAVQFWWLEALVLLVLIFLGKKSIASFGREFPSRRKCGSDRVTDD